MQFDYSKLIGRIVEVFRTRRAFAKQLGLSDMVLSNRLGNKAEWSDREIVKSCELLGIPLEEAHNYFFTLKV